MLELIVGLVILGVVLWAIQQIPMDPMIQKVIHVIIVVLVTLLLLEFLVSIVGGAFPGHLSPLLFHRCP
jgi:uncharacterized membrane protein YwzB